MKQKLISEIRKAFRIENYRYTQHATDQSIDRKIEEAEVKEAIKDCFFCGGTTEKKLVTYSKWYEGKLIAIENVPAEVCTQCGEQYFSPKVVEKLQKIVWSKAKPVKTIHVPLYSLTAKAK